MSTSAYQKIAPDESELTHTHDVSQPSPAAVASPPHSPSEKQAIQFAKTALIFKDMLDGIREKHAAVTEVIDGSSPPAAPSKSIAVSSSRPITPAALSGAPQGGETIIDRRLRLLRLVQSTLTALLAIAIAVLQARAYAAFQAIKDPSKPNPNLVPTLMVCLIIVKGLQNSN
jgi:hypothetical protein